MPLLYGGYAPEPPGGGERRKWAREGRSGKVQVGVSEPGWPKPFWRKAEGMLIELAIGN